MDNILILNNVLLIFLIVINLINFSFIYKHTENKEKDKCKKDKKIEDAVKKTLPQTKKKKYKK